MYFEKKNILFFYVITRFNNNSNGNSNARNSNAKRLLKKRLTPKKNQWVSQLKVKINITLVCYKHLLYKKAKFLTPSCSSVR